MARLKLKLPPHLAKAPTNKYSNQPEYVDGIRFASRREAKRYRELKLWQLGGEIENLECQARIYLLGQDGKPLVSDTGRQLSYLADFRYRDKRTEEVIVEDAKGAKTQVYKLKKAILRAQGITIVEI